MVELVLVQRREERNRIKPIFTDKVGKCKKYFKCTSLVYDLGVLKYFGTENCVWKVDIIKKSL